MKDFKPGEILTRNNGELVAIAEVGSIYYTMVNGDVISKHSLFPIGHSDFHYNKEPIAKMYSQIEVVELLNKFNDLPDITEGRLYRKKILKSFIEHNM